MRRIKDISEKIAHSPAESALYGEINICIIDLLFMKKTNNMTQEKKGYKMNVEENYNRVVRSGSNKEKTEYLRSLNMTANKKI